MKYLYKLSMVLMLLLAMTTTIQAQDLTNESVMQLTEIEVATAMDAVKVSSEVLDGGALSNWYRAEYTEPLVFKLKVQSFVRSYSDVSWIRTWTQEKGGITGMVAVTDEDDPFLIGFYYSYNESDYSGRMQIVVARNE